MKPQQRSFVVEYKSSRRHSIKEPRSIWGNTNFKALVKEAEAEAPRLFEGSSNIEVRGTDPEILTDDAPPIQITDDVDVDANPVISSPSERPPEDPQDLRQSFLDGDLKRGTSLETTLKKVPARKAKKAAQRRLQAEVGTTAAGKTDIATGDHIDELTLLEEENQRLKMLLTKHLLQQNAQLQQMLSRFKAQ